MDKYSLVSEKNSSRLGKTSEKPQEEIRSGDKKFLAIIAHDIKTPMSSIVGYLQVIKDGIHHWDRVKLLKYLDIALHSAERTYSVLNSLLEWANAENIYKSYQPEGIDFEIILKEEIADLEIFTLQKNIEINALVHSAKEVYADKKMVKCILRNLLVNAVKYSHTSGQIDVSLRKDKDFLEITIKDYGVGINTKTTGSIFSSTNYISTLGTENEPGSGYGLLLCKELTEINKGKIWIDGNADLGSEFKFTLPLTRTN